MPAAGLSDDVQVIDSQQLTEASQSRFLAQEERRYTYECEGWVEVVGQPGSSPGARVALFGPAGCSGSFSIAIDGDAPQRVQGIGTPRSGNLAIGLHHFRITGVFRLGMTAGWCGISVAKNNANAGSVQLQVDIIFNAFRENAAAD